MGKKILAIDDEKLILKSIKKALDRIGFEVTTACDREQFLRSIKENTYDLVILDLHMDGLTSREIMESCREKMEDVKFLIISGSELPVEENFIQKPFRIGELRERVRELLNGNSSEN